MRTILTALVLALAAPAVAAQETHQVTLTLREHRFSPAVVEVPAGRPIRILLTNEDGAMEEFDSLDLGVEKDVTPHGQVSFLVGALKPGTYSFMGELHADTAQGEFHVAPTAATR